jgi:EAL domain-containing protein (putative c-di-GMP-specific phosphodiesterase class I)
VEDEDQIQLLRELNCDCIQGFLVSRPLPPEEMKAFLGN